MKENRIHLYGQDNISQHFNDLPLYSFWAAVVVVVQMKQHIDKQIKSSPV